MALFRDLGPYQIVRQIGRGMSPVFLATDSRSGMSVALKVVPTGSDEEAREVLDAEEQGADLQRRFSELTQYVPGVFEVGRVADYFYIAMEYIDGEDLSTILTRGPLEPGRAVAIAIQLCRFLEEVDRVAGAEGESAQTLLHNDLKPGNIRLEAGDRVKILDFGAAKVLSLSRRVTRNVFGSIPYLSPECLETGKRDRHTDAWSLGVLLYEMVAGRAPFRADSTMNLERRIRSRQPPETASGVTPDLAAVIAKLLAPSPADRYDSAGAIRADLENVAAGVPTVAGVDAGNRTVGPAADEGATRRTREPIADEGATRRTREPTVDEAPTRVVARSAVDVDLAVDDAVRNPAVVRPSSPARRRVIAAFLLLIVVIIGNEVLVARRAGRVAASVPLQEFGGVTNAWNEHAALAERSYLGLGARELESALVRQSHILADRVIGNYRSPAPTVREAQWESAATLLKRALSVRPGDSDIRASLRYVQGHLHRIDGEAQKSRRQVSQSQRELADAVSAFREAAALRPEWPDPHLGLARTFIYGMEDIDRGADAMNQAQKLGYTIGPRETAQLGDGYRTRGETLERAAGSLGGLPQEHESLTRAAESFRRALELYSTIANVPEMPAKIRMTQNRLAIVEEKIERIADKPPSEGGTLGRIIDAISGAF